MKVVNKRTDSKVVVIRDLPSDFKGYSVSYLECRPLTLGEMKYIQSKDIPEKSVIEIYNNTCLNFDLNELSYHDLKYLISYITLFTKPDQKWTWKEKCKNIKCRSDVSLTLSSQNFLDFEDLKISDLPVCTTINGIDFEFGIFTVKNHYEYYEYLENEDLKYDSNLLGMALTVKNMSVETAYKNLSDITDSEDIELVAHIEKLLVHGTPYKKIICEKCETENTFELSSLEVAHLIPFRNNEKSLDSRIVFGKRFKR